MPSLKAQVPPVIAFDNSISLVDFYQKKYLNSKSSIYNDGVDLPEEKLNEEE